MFRRTLALAAFLGLVGLAPAADTKLTVKVEKAATAQAVNDAFRAAARGAMKGVLDVSDEPLVSCDYNGNRFSSTVDAALTMVVGDQVKVMSWYDNEMG